MIDIINKDDSRGTGCSTSIYMVSEFFVAGNKEPDAAKKAYINVNVIRKVLRSPNKD